jgi:hypothetical protein
MSLFGKKYRVIKVQREGYYTIYSVQKRVLWLIWDDVGRSFNTKQDAFDYIYRREIDELKPVITVEKEDV